MFQKAGIRHKYWLSKLNYELNFTDSGYIFSIFDFLSGCEKIFSNLLEIQYFETFFCYFLFREICAISEIHCDDYTLKNIKGAERKKYSNLLINLSTESFKKPEKHYAVHLVSYNVKLLERRIQEMKMPEKKKHIILACLTGGLICIIGGIPSFAYIPPSVYVLNAQVSNLLNPLESERTVYSDFDIQSVIEHIPYNYYWQGDDGSIIQLDYRQKAESSPSCTHDHIAGTIIKHIQNNDDSCKVSYTEGERCILCGKITEGKEVNAVHYGICPHEMTISEME